MWYRCVSWLWIGCIALLTYPATCNDQINSDDHLDFNTENVATATSNNKSFWSMLRGLEDYEYFLVALVLIYIILYIWGKTVNAKLANAWYSTFEDMFRQHFTAVGIHDVEAQLSQYKSDDAPPTEEDFVPSGKSSSALQRVAAHAFEFFASGKKHCKGYYVLIETQRRQDLLSWLYNMITPSYDTITIEIPLCKNVMDPYVFAVIPDKGGKEAMSDYYDLASLARPIQESKLPGSIGRNLAVTDCAELARDLLHPQILRVIQAHTTPRKGDFSTTSSAKQSKSSKSQQVDSKPDFNTKLLQKLFISVRFTDQSQKAELNTRRMSSHVLEFKFRLPPASQMESLRQLMEMTLHCIDLVAETKISHDARKRAIALRSSKVTEGEEHPKTAHEQAMETAQEKRQQKLEAEAERLRRMDPKQAAKLEQKLKQKSARKRKNTVRVRG